MPEPIPEFNENSSFTLSEFLKEVKKALDRKFKSGGYWVRGEISEWRKSWHHYYGELIEYDQNTKQPVAKIRLNLWSSIAEKIIPKFFNATGDELKSGLKVLFLVEVNFHKAYGLSLTILDVDPSFTLGDREARKKYILKELKDTKIIDQNRMLPKPLDFTSVAIISSENTAGLGDFFEEANLLLKYELCQFDIYPTSMQGNTCAEGVTNKFREIYKKLKSKEKAYDAIVLIRGGGSESDLDWFNDIKPAKAICSINVPVYTGIGHQRDQTILDLVANRSFDTPSKVIQSIVNTIILNTKKTKEVYDRIAIMSQNLFKTSIGLINQLQKNIAYHGENVLYTNNEKIDMYLNQIVKQAKLEMGYNKKHINDLYLSNFKLAKSVFIQFKHNMNDQFKLIYHKNKSQIHHQKTLIQKEVESIKLYSNNIYCAMNQNITNLYQSILSLSITPTLQRGFTLTKKGQHYVTSKQEALSYKLLTIQYHDGDIITEVQHD